MGTSIPALPPLPKHPTALDLARRASIVERFHSKYTRGAPDECWLWEAGETANGYGQLNITQYDRRGVGRPRNVRAHRVAWEIANDASVPKGLLVLHSCDCRPCVNPAHLRVGTYKDNMQDAQERGRTWRRGTPRKLNPTRVRRIRWDADRGLTRRAIAAKHEVSLNTVNLVIWRRIWAHVP